MKQTLTLPLLAACCMTFSSCVFQQQSAPTEQACAPSLGLRKQRVKDIQQAAQECASMKWVGEKPVYNVDTHSYITDQHTYPVSEADAAAIRRLLPHLQAVPTDLVVEHHPAPGAPYMACTLHFLDADGQSMAIMEYSIYGSAPDDTDGYQPCPGLSLPAADYATWKALIPADLRRSYAKAYTRWKRNRSHYGIATETTEEQDFTEKW